MYEQVKEENLVTTELHTFCDTSKDAVGAVTNLHTTGKDGTETVCFVLGKAKLAPQRGHMIPRLELSAAVLGIEVARIAKQQPDLKIDEEKYYTDGSIVLGYIYNEEKWFYVYIPNRVDRFRSASFPKQWNDVGTENNQADLATRSVLADELRTSTWIQGDDSSVFSENCQLFPLIEAGNDKEVYSDISISKTSVEQRSILNTDLFKRFSSWSKLVKSISAFKLALRHRRGNPNAGSAFNDLEIM
ncbi:uncharacterized protein LOC132557246 [Ylistrum balloti]|uniref:uncharacterized protein LOC132557246 n=1 Tax=Ylistrum balloti TaxID=509963 RepID=UPI002905E542|nr:uncharacterized protein LOC132557246 [Ylistrum balloti]